MKVSYESQRTIWAVIASSVVIVLVVVSVMAWQSLKHGGQNAVSTNEVEGISYEPYQAVRADLSLPALTSLGQYALWAVGQDESLYLIGLFQINDQGFLVDAEEKLLGGVFATDHDLRRIRSFYITVERADRVPVEPSASRLLVTERQLGRRFNLHFPFNFVSSSGSFILATPTNGQNTNETSGYWFIDEDEETVKASLNLPEAPKGWIYESWAESNGQVVSGGRFLQPVGRDDFSNFSGPRSFPDFPGEDLLTNAPDGLTFPLNLADGQGAVLVSLEPRDFDFSFDRPRAGDFGLTILKGDIINGQAPRRNIPQSYALTVPYGVITVLAR